MTTPLWYNAALALLKPLYKWRIKKRAVDEQQFQQECLERFGPFQPVKNVQAIWFHVVSVGETNAAQPLIEHYLKLGHPVLVTNTTKTGQARAKSLFLKAPYETLFQAVYLPADQKKLIADFFKKYQPKMLVLVETELWPNLIAQANQSQVPCVLVNARLSEKSAKGYGKVPSLTVPMLKGLQQLLAQDQASLTRFIELGAKQQNSHVVGSIKFDIHAPQIFIDKATQLKRDWHLATRKIITLASTHAPEEQKLLQGLKSYLAQDPSLLVIVVPRHPERFDEVFKVAQGLGLNTQRRSLNESIQADTHVYLADSMGEMWLWYALTNVCFVGGSLNEPGGGHNILEPIALEVPTVIGPNYFNFQTIVDEFLNANAVAVGQDSELVAQLLMQYLQQPESAAVIAKNAKVIMQKNSGSLAKHIQALDQYLNV
ncbi:3-deoxy-D-manno-octulosonic acid transferase [Acinetobacter shaoyimingii]|uniref:3-deoxy-D-manno-octulosonic acid transferase n=1 Tax=Acinetobacter shaoyimingii TaxID=2715164 RepID=A0A6G8RS43_9GAMM|nr:3-deoxy-D-manno-octulosonic acid transferase [Acinetobacter shaoyimingii]QIO04640.1 3-deoxy-D-manno-octulosonic acid transferase [Acinetobacter shaoyimingii]